LTESLKIFRSPYELAEKLADDLTGMINKSAGMKKPFSIALSGGSTPGLLFTILGDHYSNSVNWEYVHFFWGDERCVSSVDKDSNFGMAKRLFFDRIKIPAGNIHRVRGEDDPVGESLRYTKEIGDYITLREGFPVFDIILLGLGEDGHTASIFPGNNHLFHTDDICAVASHPVSGQKRITLTGRVINNAILVIFMVAGKNKARIAGEILNKTKSAENFPASYIVPVIGDISWYLDDEASLYLQKHKRDRKV